MPPQENNNAPQQPVQPTPPVQQPQQPQQPSAMPPQMPQQKSHKTRNTILGIVGGFLLLIIIGGAVAFFTTKGASEDANKFVDAILNKNYSQAYSYFSPELQAAQSAEQFQAGIEATELDDSCDFSVTERTAGASAGTDSSGSSKTISGVITCGDVKRATEIVFTSTDSGDKIISYSIAAAQQ